MRGAHGRRLAWFVGQRGRGEQEREGEICAEVRHGEIILFRMMLNQRRAPSGAKAPSSLAAGMYGLKSVPFKAALHEGSEVIA
jgi:hypothetical protein